MFKLYWTMYTGQKDDSISTRLDNLFANKKFSEVGKKLVTPLKLSLSKEVVRRHHYLNLPGREPRTPNWSANRSTNKLSSPEFALPMEEVSFIKEYLYSFIDTHEAIMKKNKELSKEEGDEISKTDKQRMRMWEAVFADKNRAHLMQMNNSHSKAQMDAWNSPEKIASFYKIITNMYNDASWEPMSSHFGSMHDRLDTSICLKLIGGPIKVEVAKKWYCSVKGKLNKSIAFYKRSGNGTGNLREQSVNSTSTSSGPLTNENIVDDNRSSFISNLHVGYFWALSEVCGLTNNISQNCSKVGISSTSTMSSSTASSSMHKGKK
jgi:hypothetical protein